MVTAGALSYDKGTLHLLRAARRLWEAGIPLELALVGTPDRRVELAVRLLSHDYRQHCHILTRVSEARKWDVLAAADFLALPSRTESFGIVFLEAWLLRKPVIGAKVGAVADVIDHGVDGLLVDFGDVNALSDAMRIFVEQPDIAARMGAHGHAKVLAQYGWETQYGHLREVVNKVTAESMR